MSDIVTNRADLPEPPDDFELTREEPLSGHTYMRLGGPAAYFGTPPDVATVVRIGQWAREHDLPLLILGGGSNVLISERGVRAVVLSLRHASQYVEFEGTGVRAGAGVMLPALARAAAQQGLTGLEFAIGIPGTVGGALQSNAGIGPGRDIGRLVEQVDVLRDGEWITLERGDLTFDYRSTSLRGTDDIILDASLRLSNAVGDEVSTEMTRLLTARKQTQPTAEHNAGSMFRNPDGDYAGRLIEAAGLKGESVGDASVSTLHANFIVHSGSASATDVATLMMRVQATVVAQFGVRLDPEVVWWGDGTPPPVFT